MEKINLDKTTIKTIIKLIVRYKKPEKILIFGSRATNNSRSTSDIDIAIFGRDWTDKDINITRHNLNEFVKSPLKFDVLNFYQITKEKLKENILKSGRIIYELGKN